MKRSLKVLCFALALVLVAALSPGLGNATTYLLTDLNSSVSIDDASQAGVYGWQVDGNNRLYQQWFWYRVGNQTPEQPISNLTLVSATTGFGTTGLQLVYKDPTGLFDVTITYILTGGAVGSGTSDLAETIRITSLSSASLDFHFFQYSDFDLNGPGGDTVTMVNANTVRQTGQGIVSETVITPSPTLTELAYWSATLNKLNNANVDNLNGTGGPLGPGDVTWAFQWDTSIAAGGTYIISKDKHIVPLPATALLLGTGLLGLVGLRYRSRKKR